MRTYFKAVREDGTDFHSGTVRWVPEGGIPEGGWVVTHPGADRLDVGDPATYLSVATVPTDCTGMRWPCRLLEVAPAGQQWRRATEMLPHKRMSLAWRVMRELPAWQALGPQGREVAAIIDRAARLTLNEARSLTAASYAASGAAINAASYAAWDAARAYLVRDLIPANDFAVLAGPWHQVIGSPEVTA